MAISIKSKLIIPIIAVAFFLRFFRLGTYPALNPDEAAIGYNAYSLIQTGKDEHGQSWPLHFTSFGDYKPGGYFYLAMPFIKLLGLSPLAVRLPNLLLSTLSIYYLFRLLLLLTKSARFSLIAAFVLTISPWHLHFSRGAWESGAALSLIIIGTFYFFLFLDRYRPIHYFFFLFTFVSSLYIYHSARIIAPLLYLSFTIGYFPRLRPHLKKILLPSFICLLLVIPVTLSFFQSGGTARFSGVGLTSDQGPLWRSHELLNQHQANLPDFIIYRIIHNKRTLYLISWVQKYLAHFDPNFLFLTGDEVPRSKLPDIGQFYLFEIVLLLLGIRSLLRLPRFKQLRYPVITWLLISPLAASLTFQSPSALRSLPLVIPLIVIISAGIYYLTSPILVNSLFRVPPLLFIFAICLLYIVSFTYYLDAYYRHYSLRFPFAWNTGFSTLIPKITRLQNQYDNIYVTDKYDQPYILYLFFSRYPPKRLQPQIRLTPKDQFGFSTVRQIDNINFGPIDLNTIPAKSLIVSAQTLPLNQVDSVILSDSQTVFYLYEKI